MGMLQAFDKIANEGWPDGDYRVFVKPMGRLDWENYLQIDLSDLAREMGRDCTGVSRSVSRLVKRGILHRGPRVGRAYTYRLDPATAWRGAHQARTRVQQELDKRGRNTIQGDTENRIDREQPLPGM